MSPKFSQFLAHFPFNSFHFFSYPLLSIPSPVLGPRVDLRGALACASTPFPSPSVLRLTAIRAVEVLYNPKDQQGCQRRYTTRETLATMARKCQRRRRSRMRSKDNSSCARMQAGTLASTSSTVVVVQSGQSGDCPSNCMGYLYN